MLIDIIGGIDIIDIIAPPLPVSVGPIVGPIVSLWAESGIRAGPSVTQT